MSISSAKGAHNGQAPTGHHFNNEYMKEALLGLEAIVSVPTDWTHFQSPLHYLLAFQGGCCGICTSPATFTRYEFGSKCSLAQVLDGEDRLVGLVCQRCLVKYSRCWDVDQFQVDDTDAGTERVATAAAAAAGLCAGIGDMGEAVRGFFATAPAQACPVTTGKVGLYTRARAFKHHHDAPVEVPGPKWTGTNTVLHTLFLFQNRRCGICKDPLLVASDPRGVHTDHDWRTGKVRGLLCRRCNIAEGRDFGDLDFWSCCRTDFEAYIAHPPAEKCLDTIGLAYGPHRQSVTIRIQNGHLYIGSMPEDWCAS